MRFTAAFCPLSDFTYFRSDSQKMRKSGQIADVCSSQMVVKIRGFTTKDFAEENQRFYYNTDFWFCIVPMSISGLWQMGVHLCTPITILSRHSEHFLYFLSAKLIHLPAGIFNLGYPTEFVLNVLKTEMCVSIQSNTDVAVSHKVLQRFRVHAGC